MENMRSRTSWCPIKHWIILIIANKELLPDPTDLNYYTHECRDFQRYCNLGWETGEPAGIEGYNLWNNAHTATPEDFKLTDSDLFHPDAIK